MKPNGTDLVQWADRLDCRARLPELVRRLVHATISNSDVESIDFPSGEGIQRPGFDGLLKTSSSNAFVPLGLSAWEIGCSQDVQSKASRDYDKRKENLPPGISPRETTYVFVTPRRWTARASWAAGKAAEGFWADVRAYDADSLEQWIALAPATGVWLAEVLEKVSNSPTLERHWREWSARTHPRPTSDALVLVGRDDAIEAMFRWLRGSPQCLEMVAEDPEEVVAFLWAALQRLPRTQGERWVDRAAVVNDDATLRRMADDGRDMLIAALGCKVEVARLAAEKGHHVLYARSTRPAGECIELGPLDPLDWPKAAAAVERMGVAQDKAQQYANDSKGHLAALRRLLGDEVKDDTALGELAPLLLVGSWRETQAADIELVSKVLGRSESELRVLVRRHSVQLGAPLRQVGDTWTWVSRIDAWQRLARYLVHADLVRFSAAAEEALCIPGPPRQSAAFRHGLVEGGALLATGRARLSGALDGQVQADCVVRRVLKRLDTWEGWATLDRLLPMLAEASPTAFLQGVRRLLEQRSTIVPQRDGLILALETLAWSADYLGEAAELLADLATLERTFGEKSRAFDSLREIFLPWLPHTMAGVEDRISALNSLCQQFGSIGFDLLLSLLAREFSTGTQKPLFRPWLEGRRDGVTEIERTQMLEAIEDRVVSGAEAQPERWCQVLPILNMLSQDVHLPRARAALQSLDLKRLDGSQRAALRMALRSELARHRSFPGVWWSMSEENLAKLDQLESRLVPSDIAERHSWLFDHGAVLPTLVERDWRKRREALENERRTVADALVKHLALPELLRFAQMVKAPRSLGEALASIENGAALAHELISQVVGVVEPWSREFRAGLVAVLFEKHGYQCLELLGAYQLAPLDRSEVALGLLFQVDTWNLVESWGSEAAANYWRNTRVVNRNRDEGLTRALESLLAVGRPFEALELAGWSQDDDGATKLDPGVIIKVLEATSAGDAEMRDREQIAYLVGRLLGQLDSVGPEWLERRSRIEWDWLPELDSANYQPMALLHALATDPGFFVKVLSWVFKAEDAQDQQEPTREELARAKSAAQLLKEWNDLPGAHADGSIDGEFLERWIRGVREIARAKRLGRVADRRIGDVLAAPHSGTDGYWPHESIRDLLEHMPNTSDIETGLSIARLNQRGVSSRRIGDGGRREWEMAAKYRSDAGSLRSRWPTTARVLSRVADNLESEARYMDEDGARERESFVREMSTEDRLGAFVQDLQSRGRYTFPLSEAVTDLKEAEAEVRRAAVALTGEARRLVSPDEGFYVIVPIEYHSAGSPPPTWYLDDWMRWAKEPYYYAALLTAAELHGAAHQQPQVFQVVTGHERPSVTVGRVRIEFIQADDVEEADVEGKKTQTGQMRVSSPETTVFDLIRHVDRVGGIDIVATVLSELGESVEAERLYAAAGPYDLPTIQRAGWLLRRVGFEPRTSKLRERIEATTRDVPLRKVTDRPPLGPSDDVWHVQVDTEIELDL